VNSWTIDRIIKLKILGLQTCSFRDAGQHTRSDLGFVVKGEDKIWPAIAS
jgi:hypothetical protein